MSFGIRCALLRRHTITSRYCFIWALALLLSACGGGGGGGSGSSSQSGPTLAGLSTNSLSFSAASPTAPVPASQVVTATVTGVTSGTLFIRIDIDGQVIASATNVQIISSTQGQVTFNPGMPANLGSGTHTSVITISICTTDASCSGAQLAGSQTINVTYQIGSPVQSDAIAPYVGTTNTAGEVILRGQGFSPANAVNFGGTPGTILSVPSDTEIRASYPALAAGNHAVTLNNGAIPFTASLTIVDPPAYPSASLAYPSVPQEIRGLAYDAERKALLVGIGFTSAANNQILRYQFSSGTWATSSAAVTFADLRDIALSLNGSRLLAIADGSLGESDPVNLTPVTTTPKPSYSADPTGSEYLNRLVVANDGNAVIATGYKSGSGATKLYTYLAGGFSARDVAGSLPVKSFFNRALLGASGNGAVVALLDAVFPAQPVYRYSTSAGILSATGVAMQPSGSNEPAFDRAGTRMAVGATVGSSSFIGVYDASFALLGLLPSTTAAYVVSPDGTRAYTVETGSPCQVRAFDLVTTPGGNNPLTEVIAGYPITPVACPAAFPFDIRMSVSPAGDTLFMAGNVQVVIVPLP